MVLAEWEGYLFVFIGNKVFLADSRGVFTNENHIEYEWFYWELYFNSPGEYVTSAKVYDGMLYVGTSAGGVYTFDDYTSDVESYWVTPKDKFGYPHMQKTTNKRGVRCLVVYCQKATCLSTFVPFKLFSSPFCTYSTMKS